MKKILILLILMFLLGGGGGGYYYFFVLATDTSDEPPPPPPAPDFRFVEMQPLRIPVIRGGAVVNYVVLNVTLETIGADNEEFATSLLPRVRNAFITDLNGYFAAVSVEDRILVKAIKRRLHIIANRTLGPGVVHDVLIQNAFKQRK